MDIAMILLMLVLTSTLSACNAVPSNHIVGDSIWSIPLTNDFYTNWSNNNKSFHAGDSLVFKFETGFYDVVQVSRREYENCSAENPFRSFDIGPATVPLNEEGVCYFLCSFGNYCSLGMKLAVVVQGQLPLQ